MLLKKHTHNEQHRQKDASITLIDILHHCIKILQNVMRMMKLICEFTDTFC